MRSPGLRIRRAFSGMLLTKVPFLLPRSWTVHSPSCDFEGEVLAGEAGVFRETQLGGAGAADGQPLAGQGNRLRLPVGALDQQFARHRGWINYRSGSLPGGRGKRYFPIGSLLADSRANEPVQARELAIEVGVALFEELRLPSGAHAAAGAVSVFRIEPVHHVHAFDHLAERREARPILLRHVAGSDEDLGRSGVRGDHGEGKRAARVGCPLGVGLDLHVSRQMAASAGSPGMPNCAKRP